MQPFVSGSAPDSLLCRGRYALLAPIGRGGAGTVWRARDLAGPFPREVCLKRLARGVGVEEVRALREEARLLLGLRHSNVVALLAVEEDPPGVPILVLELVEGVDLRALYAAAPVSGGGYLPDPVAVHVACAVLRALGAAERAMPGLVHRDVTPHNVLVSTEGEVKLADFGIALARDRGRWTRPALVKGKLGYMAPEQVRGEELDPRTDLFAVGVTLYELLARTRPWPGQRAGMQRMDELRAIERGDLLPLSLHRPGLARGLTYAVERLLASDRASRPASADDALRALAPWSAGELGPLRLASCVRAATASLQR